MDDDDIFNSITGGTSQPTQPVNNVPISQPVSSQNDDPFGLLSLNVGGTSQPQTTFTQPATTGFDMGLLGFGNPNPPQQQPVNTQQTNNQPQNNGGFSLLGDDFLGLGGGQPTQQVNNVQPQQNTGFSFNQNPPQNQGFNWGQTAQQPQVNQPQQNPNKFLAYENSQIQIYMNCVK